MKICLCFLEHEALDGVTRAGCVSRRWEGAAANWRQDNLYSPSQLLASLLLAQNLDCSITHEIGEDILLPPCEVM